MRKATSRARNDWFKIVNKDDDEPLVYIYDEIGFWGTEASEFVKQLQDIDAASIQLHINSPGGEVFDGLAIFNALKQHKTKVNVYIDGLAASAASFIAQAGDTVTIARNAQLMIHDGIAFAYGNEKDMLDTAGLLGKISNNIADIYAESAAARGFDTTLEDFRDLMREEVWYTGKEAVSSGLADIVLDHDDDDEDADDTPKNTWDLSFFNYAGREKAESPLRIQERIRLANRQKESDMPKGKTPKATTDPEVTPAPAPDTTPPPEPETNPEPETDPETDPETEPTEPTDRTPAQPTNKAGQQGVLINGKLETDWSVINKHFESLQAAQDEQRATFRKDFVEGLAAANKIPATQIDSLLELVNGTDTRPGLTDEQFAAFEASFESTPASSLFQGYAASDSAPQPGTVPNVSADERTDRIAVLEGTVAMHRRTMPEDKVQNTKSYIELQQLLGNNQS